MKSTFSLHFSLRSGNEARTEFKDMGPKDGKGPRKNTKFHHMSNSDMMEGVKTNNNLLFLEDMATTKLFKEH